MEAFAGLAEKEQEPMQKKGQRNGKRNWQGVEVAHEAEPACGVSGWVLAAVAPSGGASGPFQLAKALLVHVSLLLVPL